MWPLTLTHVTFDLDPYGNATRWSNEFFLAISFLMDFYSSDFFSSTDKRTDRRKATHKSPPCMSTGGLNEKGVLTGYIFFYQGNIFHGQGGGAMITVNQLNFAGIKFHGLQISLYFAHFNFTFWYLRIFPDKNVASQKYMYLPYLWSDFQNLTWPRN